MRPSCSPRSPAFDAWSARLPIILGAALCAAPALAAAPDGDVEWDGVFADTTARFVEPVAPVAGGPLTLRLRAWADDLTGATCKLFYAGVDQQVEVPMQRAGTEGPFDIWRCAVDALPAGATEVYYRFAVTDGADTDYYDAGHPDDDWTVRGMSDEDRGFFDFRLYLGLTTPGWSQGATFYQIFPDRFFDGAPRNNRQYPEDCFWYLDFAPADRDAPECEAYTVVEPPPGQKTCAVVEDWETLPNGGPCDYFGGDLPGVEQKLTYLDDLGIDAVYLNPVFRSPSNHKYDTMTYDVVDPRFGGTGALASLTEAVHARGLRIIVDGVFNHVSDLGEHFNLWQNYARDAETGRVTGVDAFPRSCGAWEMLFAASESGCEASPYSDWFTLWIGRDEWDVDRDGDRAEEATHTCGWAGLEFMPDIDYRPPAEADSGPRMWLYGGSRADDPTVARATVAGKWLADGVMMPEGLDGWRLDVPDNAGWFEGLRCDKVATDPTIWQGFRTAVKTVGADKYISGEIWTDASESGGLAGDWFRQRTYDGVMNYHYFATPVSCLLTGLGVHARMEECLDGPFGAMIRGEPTAIDAFDRHMARQRRVYPSAVYFANQNLLSSHDSARFASRVEGDHRKQRLGMFLQATLPGAPMIYYGDEVAHGEDAPPGDASNERGRATMPWRVFDDAAAPPAQTREYQRSLLCLRRGLTALRTGSFLTLHTHNSDETYAFARFDEAGPAIAVMSNGDGARRVSFDARRTGLPADAALVDALGGGEVSLVGHQLSVDLEAFGAMLLVPAADAEALAGCRAPNRAPVADAGPGGMVASGAVVTLDGSGSADPDGGALDYAWYDESGAVLSRDVALNLPELADGRYTFTLVVDDGVYRSRAEATWVVGTPPPEPDMGPDRGLDPEPDMGLDPGMDPEPGMEPEPSMEPEPLADGGLEDDGGASGSGGGAGCACAAGPSEEAPLSALLMLGLLLGLRRRR